MDLISTHIVKTSDIGFHGNLFGGKLMAWVDAAAAAYASQTCDTPRVVTVLIDKCEFRKPTRTGQLIKIYGEVNQVNNTSIELNIEARSHNVYTGKQAVILTTNITFVRIDEGGNPIPISDKVRQKYMHRPF
tara:strand:+ start:4873 stop:5268 length:396 start_codon:yes stop_codon:yes gene_type:complete